MFRPGEWYKNLAKPWWTPPDWLFGPVWTLLYLFMGVAAWLVWRRGGFQEARGALALFLVQLLLNALWSWVFFGLQQPGWAFLELSLLWLAIAATLAAFWRLVPAAGWLLAPYLAWVSFAGVLNFALWHLNC
jgi:tryptophan-rich sensory protein